MGNYNTGSVRFRQSLKDFPLTVNLDKNIPEWSLSRWHEKNCLRFIPVDEEGFTLRGDKRQLLYKGRRRSHRFTILNDGAFEYDCILQKEPESNVITLRMEGAELYEFFKQPDFVPDDFLKGSYAVYKKETLIGEGTGKLCHIHRPLIIDSRGRKVWGELSIDGNTLNVIIPEWWLASAKYPVTVDPTIGTTTVGSQYRWVKEQGEDPETLYFEIEIPVNRFLISETINGQCTAFYYVNEDDYDGGGKPVIYSKSNTRPQNKKSTNENFINFRVTSNNPKGWRSGTFNSNGSITNGSYIWFGLFSQYYWFPRFDYGSKCFFNSFEYEDVNIPNIYPNYQWSYFTDFKLSMYFTYTSAQNYVRTLTQGLNLSDSLKLSSEYKRTSSQTAQITDTRNLKTDYRREFKETQGITDVFQQVRDYIRCLKIETAVIAETERCGDFYRKQSETVNVEGFSFRHLFIFIKLFSTSMVRDFILKRFLVSKEQIELKSLITKNLTLESKIN